MRNEILNYIVDLINNNKTEIRTVTRRYRNTESIRPYETPIVFVIDGVETRKMVCNRDLCEFEVILRIVVYNEDNTSEILNKAIQESINIIYSDKFLGGNSVKPIKVLRIETDEGWLYPFGIADVRILTAYNM